MRVNSLHLFQFRNYKNKKFDFSPDIIVLYGNNGIGKTNILESLYVGTIGRSHRTTEDKDMIAFDSENAGIVVDFFKNDIPQKITIKLVRQGRKELKLNDNKITQKELLGTLNTVIFSPEDLMLIKGNPRLRRRFLDIELSQTSANYYHQLSLYNKALQQRNKILKDYVGKKLISLEEWDIQIANSAAYIVQKRLESLKKINMLANLMNRRITGGKENFSIIYEQSYAEKYAKNGKYLTTSEEFREALIDSLEYDRFRLNTSVGPHRDDLSFYSDTIDLKKFGSQGQQRTAILSLKLSELEFIKSEVGEYPILLLDDVMSELDKSRRSNLLGFIHKRIQTFITTTEFEEFKELSNVQNINVENEVKHQNLAYGEEEV